MTTDTTTTDATMAAIAHAVTLDTDAARESLLELWEAIGPVGDPLHRCTLAHYLADRFEHAADALTWDIRALDAAAALTDDRVARYHPALTVRGFYPSLHLNLSDNYRRLGAFDTARDHLESVRAHLDFLADDGYGRMIRTAVDSIDAAIHAKSAARDRP